MIFFDTGAFLARHIASDPYHLEAVGSWAQLSKAGTPCFTRNFVLDETFTLLARRAGAAFAIERARNILSSETMTILRPGHEDELSATDDFEKLADQDVSVTDCVSFTLMRRAKLQRAFTLDAHFR